MTGYSQGNVIRHSLGLYKVLWLMLCNYLPCNSIIYTVLEEHCLIYSVRITQIGIATVCL